MSRSRSRFGTVAALAVLLAPAAGLPAAEIAAGRIQTRLGADTMAVFAALNGAQRKLRDPECQRLLTDFTDGEGRTLAESLARFGTEPADYLTTITIRDGADGASLCRRPWTAAVTTPNARFLYVCGAFRWQGRGARENTLIHEMLHTLGLGENPPRSDAISAQVARRCGN